MLHSQSCRIYYNCTYVKYEHTSLWYLFQYQFYIKYSRIAKMYRFISNLAYFYQLKIHHVWFQLTKQHVKNAKSFSCYSIYFIVNCMLIQMSFFYISILRRIYLHNSSPCYICLCYCLFLIKCIFPEDVINEFCAGLELQLSWCNLRTVVFYWMFKNWA